MKTLLITNGDSAAGLLREAGVEADILPWQDCLHIGPVPQTETDAELRNIRGSFLTSMSEKSVAEISEELKQRDNFIAHHGAFDRIELWFEHDLYDQLQLVQIVDMLTRHSRRENIILVQAPTYLGMQRPDNILRFKDLALPVNDAMIATAAKVWKAFRQSDPQSFAALVAGKIAGFAFLPAAIRRMLEELPGPDGLSRTERQILYSINRGVNRPGPLFARVMAMEEAVFWGDTGFFSSLSNLAQGAHPMIRGLSEPFESAIMEDDERRKAFILSSLELSETGSDVLAGNHDYADLNEIDFWWGGTHITKDRLWRWNAESRALELQNKQTLPLH